MARRGTYKYICEECQAENWLTTKERGSRFKPHCTGCGSTWLEPSPGSSGPKKISIANTAAKENNSLMDKKMNK